MSKLIFTMDRDWLKSKRPQCGNIVRKLEGFVKTSEEFKFMKSDSDSITLEVEEAKRDIAISFIATRVASIALESKPWQYLRVSGDSRDLSIPDADSEVTVEAGLVTELEKATELANQEAKKAEEEARAAARAKREAEDAARAERKAAREKEEAERNAAREAEKTKSEESESQLEEQPVKIDKAPQEQPVEAPSKPAAEPEETPMVADRGKQTVAKLCESVPMKYSPELAEYISEIGKVIPMLSRMHSKDCLWAQNLLVSIDSGCGYTSFLQAIAKIYQSYDISQQEKPEDAIKEYVISNNSTFENKYDDWKKALDRAQELARSNGNRIRKTVMSLDISQWQGELTSSIVLDYLRQIGDAATNFTLVFRVPFMESQVVKKVSEVLNDVMLVKTLTVAPISIENMVDYITSELVRLNCNVAQDCGEAIERLIIREKSDDSFFGFKTLDKIVKSVIYQKALQNCMDDTVDRNITAELLIKLCDDPIEKADPYKLLNDLIGIEEVKRRVREIVISIKTQKEQVLEGKDIERPCIHMMFTGNPGTGKTTVARILGRIMKEEGVLRKGYFYEIKGRDLCGRYVGETAPKTSTYCRDAYGSVLFIDEAYGLYQHDMGRDYGKEAIQTLIAEMENHRDDFCVIMAGYADEMEEMLEANQGLESRIPYILHFPNYKRDELATIFFKMIGDKIEYTEDLKEAVEQFFADLSEETMNDKTFSNARLVRNLFERAWGKAAYRRSLSGSEEKLTIRKEDLLCASEEAEFKKMLEDKGQKRIGFV